jgi:hypothetical protein
VNGAASVVAPLKGTTGHARPGKVRIRARTSDNERARQGGRRSDVGLLAVAFVDAAEHV